MKKFMLFVLAALLFVSQNDVYAYYQNIDTVQIVTKQLTKKEQRKLKKQQKKEEKRLLEEQENEFLGQQENVNEESNSINNDSGQIEKNTGSTSEKIVDQNLIDSDVRSSNQNQHKSSDNSFQSNQKQENKNEEDSTASSSFSTKEKTIIWFILIGVILLGIMRYRYIRKCTGCKKWNAMKKIKTECIDEKPSVIVEKREMKNSKGEVMRTWEESVPATTYYYRIHRKCKHCDYTDYLSSSEILKN